MTEAIQGAPSHSPSRLGVGLLWGLQLVLVCIVLGPMIFLPFCRDQGHFAYVGQVILDGGLPYRDAMDAKGPATHYTYALAMRLCGESEIGVRTFFYLLAVLGAQLAACLGKRMVGAWAILPCGLCYAIAALQGDAQCAFSTAMVEDVILPLTLLAVLLLGSPNGGRAKWRPFAAGVVLGLACMYKPTVLAVCVPLAVVYCWQLARDEKVSPGGILARLGLAAGGTLVAPLAFAGYFAAHGAFGDMWEMLVSYNMEYGGIRLAANPYHLVKFLDVRWRVLTVLAVLSLYGWGRGGRATWRLVLAALLGSWLNVVWQGKFFGYQWTPMIGCLAVLAGCTCALAAQAGWRRFTSRAGRAAVAGALLLAVPIVAAPYDSYYITRLYYGTKWVLEGAQTPDAFRADFIAGSNTHEVLRGVADYLRDHTRPDETVMIWGQETLVYFLADRRAASRFMLDHPMSMNTSFRKKWREQFLDDIRRSKPVYILIVERDAGDFSAFEPEPSDQQLLQFPAFCRLLEEQYEFAEQIENFRILRRKPSGARLPATQASRLPQE